MSTTDAVILVPGFLGFGQIGHFRYFAGRVGAALRGFLSGVDGPPVPVVPVRTCPTDPLAERQLALIKALQWADCRLGHVQRLHLVGHSTGGVDAYLLTHATPLTECVTWQDLDPQNVRHKIRSITAIASPFAGTCLALSPLACAFKRPLSNLTQSPRLALTMWHLATSLKFDEFAVGALIGALIDNSSAAAYVLDVLQSRTLVDDLQPRHMVQIQQHARTELDDVPLHSVVTLAGKYTPSYVGGSGQPSVREPDAFFKDLFAHAAGSGFDEVHDDRPRVESALVQIQSAVNNDKLIANSSTVQHPISAPVNDGLVNSARQLINPDDADELLAVVVGDHIDVMGYYPQWTTAVSSGAEEERVMLRSGILHSGSGFGDEQFFDLFQRVAQTINSAIP